MVLIHSVLFAQLVLSAQIKSHRPSVQQGITVPKELLLSPSVLWQGLTAQQVQQLRPPVQVGATARLRSPLQRVLEGATVHKAQHRLFSVLLDPTVPKECLHPRSVPLVATVLLDPALRPSVLLDTTVALLPRKLLARLGTIAQQEL